MPRRREHCHESLLPTIAELALWLPRNDLIERHLCNRYIYRISGQGAAGQETYCRYHSGMHKLFFSSPSLTQSHRFLA